VSGDRITYAGPRAKAQVPSYAAVVNAAGKTVIPGLIDVHCHLNQPREVMLKLLPVALSWGVTTIRMTGNDKPEIMDVYYDAKAGKFLAPRVYSAGQGFNLTGPYPGAPTLKPTTPDEARKGVQAHKALKVDFIKIWMGDKGFTPEVVAAIVDEAKKQGIPIVAHIGNVQQVRQLADMGVTDFLHEARDGMNAEFIAYAKAKNLSFAPTLGQGQSRWFYYEHPEFLKMDAKFDGFYARGRAMLNDPARKKEIIEAADFEQVKQRFKENNYPFIKMMSDNGVRVITGTDCGAEASQTTPVGHTTHREIAMFVEAGMAPAKALQAATLDAARVLERTENPTYGSLQAGKIADLVVLNGDPLADINNTIKIDRVMRAGRWVQ
jgi:imidazolonepropionase-like amidohydrolase